MGLDCRGGLRLIKVLSAPRCPKCGTVYKEPKKHLKKCFPGDSEDDLIMRHKAVREATAAFTKGQAITEQALAEKMIAVGFRLQDLSTAILFAESLGHVVHQKKTIIVPPPGQVKGKSRSVGKGKARPVHEPVDSDIDQALPSDEESPDPSDDEGTFPLAKRLRAREPSPTPPGPPDSPASPSPSDDSSNDPTLRSNPGASHHMKKSPQKLKPRKQRVQRDFKYKNNPQRRAMRKEGLYKKIPATATLLKGFNEWLLNSQGMSRPDTRNQIITRVVKYMRHLQVLADPLNTNPMKIDVAAFKLKDHCTSFLDHARKQAAMKELSTRNYMNNVILFATYLTKVAPITEEEVAVIKRFKGALKTATKGSSKAIALYNSRKGTRKVLVESAAPPSLAVCQQILERQDVRDAIDAVIKKAKAGEDIAYEEKRLVMRYLSGAIFQVAHFHRPGVPNNLTMAEWTMARQIGDWFILAVSKHKTGVHQPAILCLSADEYELMRDYCRYVRKEWDQDGHPEHSLFFRVPKEGTKIDSSKELNRQ